MAKGSAMNEASLGVVSGGLYAQAPDKNAKFVEIKNAKGKTCGFMTAKDYGDGGGLGALQENMLHNSKVGAAKRGPTSLGTGPKGMDAFGEPEKNG
jgi:hypothetical protein